MSKITVFTVKVKEMYLMFDIVCGGFIFNNLNFISERERRMQDYTSVKTRCWRGMDLYNYIYMYKNSKILTIYMYTVRFIKARTNATHSNKYRHTKIRVHSYNVYPNDSHLYDLVHVER